MECWHRERRFLSFLPGMESCWESDSPGLLPSRPLHILALVTGTVRMHFRQESTIKSLLCCYITSTTTFLGTFFSLSPYKRLQVSSDVWTPRRQIRWVTMKLCGQAKATGPVSSLSPPPPCQRKALVALWCAGGVGGHGIWALLSFHWGELSSSLEGDCLMSCWWSLLSQVALSYENRWMFQAPSQAAGKCQPWCTQMAFPKQRKGGLQVVSNEVVIVP